MPRHSLYRQDALDAQREHVFGPVLMDRSTTWTTLCGLSVLMAAAVLLFAGWGQFTRKEHVSGFLAPTKGIIKLYTPQAGTVHERRVVEGQSVAAGDVLLVVSSERANASNATPQATMMQELSGRRASLQREQAKQSQIDQLAENALTDRIRGLEAEMGQAESQVGLQRERVATAERAATRQQQLVAAHFVSEAALEQQQGALLDARNQLATVQRSVTALRRDLDTARLELSSSALKRANNAAAIDRQISELDQQRTEADTKRLVVLRAPAAGTVTNILTDVGQAANPAVPLLSILPQGAELEAHLLVPTRAAGFIKPQQQVALRYQAFPYQRFGHYLGQVVDVGRNALLPNESSLPVPVVEPVYIVTVRLPLQSVQAYGQSLPLQAGMTVDADVHVDRRRLIEWIFDPVLSISGRV